MLCANHDCPFIEFLAGSEPLSVTGIQCMVSATEQKVTFRQGETLFLQGQPSTNLYSLTDGVVKICSHTTDGREQIVGLSSPGNLLVGLQSINEERYAYSATAVTGVRACKISHELLLARVRNKGDLAIRLINALNAQLAHSRVLMQVMGRKCAAAKIASFILLMTPNSQHGNCRFTLPFTRFEIGGLLGLSEETVCRLMANMNRMGIIYAPRGNIEIRDWDQLRAIANETADHRSVAILTSRHYQELQ
jgi:CRP/FNR family transcriptional regulator